MASKATLRKELRERLKGMDSAERVQKSTAIVAVLDEMLGERKGMTKVLTFAALSEEPDLGLLWGSLHPVEWIFPRVEQGGELSLWSVEDPTDLERGAYGVMEPMRSRCEEVAPKGLEVILVPGVGFDPKDGMRLGKGGGFYDRLLKGGDFFKIGVGFAMQLVQNLPRENHDIGVDVVVTESGPVTFSSSHGESGQDEE